MTAKKWLILTDIEENGKLCSSAFHYSQVVSILRLDNKTYSLVVKADKGTLTYHVGHKQIEIFLKNFRQDESTRIAFSDFSILPFGLGLINSSLVHRFTIHKFYKTVQFYLKDYPSVQCIAYLDGSEYVDEWDNFSAGVLLTRIANYMY